MWISDCGLGGILTPVLGPTVGLTREALEEISEALVRHKFLHNIGILDLLILTPQGISSPAVDWWLQGLDQYRLKDADEIGRIDLVGHGVQFTIVFDIAKAEP